MPTRTSRQSHRGGVGVHPFDHVHGTQQKRAHVTRTAEFLVDRIRANLKEAARVLPQWFYHWTIQNDEVAPSTEGEFDAAENCPLSYGVGVLPGYVKKGFTTIIPVHANRMTKGVNVLWDYASQRSTPVLTMQPTSVWAEAQTDWTPLGPNYGIDLLNPLISDNVQIEYTWDGMTWGNINDNAFLTDFRAATRIKFKIILHRTSIHDPLPEMAGLVIRYQSVAQPAIRGDLPKFNFLQERDELGLVQILETYNLYLGHEAGDVKLGDFFEHIGAPGTEAKGTLKRFKVVSEEPLNIPIEEGLGGEIASAVHKGGLIGNDIQVRLVQPDEPLAKIR